MKNASHKIFISVLTAGIVGILAVVMLMSHIANLSEGYRVIADEYFENTKDASDIRMLLHKHQALVGKHVSADENKEYLVYESEALETERELKKTFAEFGKRMNGGEKESIYHNAYTEFLSYIKNAENAMTFSRAGNKGTAYYYVDMIMEGHIKKVNSAFDQLNDFTTEEIAQAKDKMELYISISTLSGIISIVAIIISLIITLVFCVKITSDLDKYNDDLEKGIAKQTKMIMAQNEQREQLLSETVFALANAVDAKDNYTSGHSRRVADYSKLIAQRMGKSRLEQEEIYRAGLLHDIGKIRVPEGIINKPAKLTPEEYAIIKLHPITGYHILKGVSSEKIFADGARFHHERYDGKGYPIGLKGEQIPEVARIIGIADAYDAMASSRSYRDTMTQEAVRSEIERCKGTQFDPEIADIMLALIDEDRFYKMREPKPANKKILAIDDDSENIYLFSHALRDINYYEVIGASSGEEALKLLKEEQFDIAIVDIHIQDMSGYELAEKIRQFSNIPIVLMTDDQSSVDINKFKKYNIADFIPKPFTPSALKEILHAVLAD